MSEYRYNHQTDNPERGMSEPTITDEMVTTYLEANNAYWKAADAMPETPLKWRNGTPSEATRFSLRAALAAAPPAPDEDGERAALQATIDRLMLEFCPDEMTPEQVKRWSDNQVPASPQQTAAIDAALAPERTVPISHADIPYMTIPPKPVISESLTINYPPDRTESAALQENGQLCNAKGTPTAPETRPASAADPVSPLLPGLEQSNYIDRMNAYDKAHPLRYDQAHKLLLVEAEHRILELNAEISRLKGEGRGS